MATGKCALKEADGSTFDLSLPVPYAAQVCAVGDGRVADCFSDRRVEIEVI